MLWAMMLLHPHHKLTPPTSASHDKLQTTRCAITPSSNLLSICTLHLQVGAQRKVKPVRNEFCAFCEQSLVTIECDNCERRMCERCSGQVHRQRCRRRHVHKAIEDVTDEVSYRLERTCDLASATVLEYEAILGDEMKSKSIADRYYIHSLITASLLSRCPFSYLITATLS